MTRKEVLVAVVTSVTYKPGWTFAVEDFMGIDGSRILAMNVLAEAICVDSGEPITIDRTFIFKPDTQLDPPPAVFIQRWVESCIKEIEDHEFKEWLKFAGRPWHPHLHSVDGY